MYGVRLAVDSAGREDGDRDGQRPEGRRQKRPTFLVLLKLFTVFLRKILASSEGVKARKQLAPSPIRLDITPVLQSKDRV